MSTVLRETEERILPSNPFYSLRYHFGMLLGVEDFETEQAYHRGKHRLHNAWLHGEGVVWGLAVGLPVDDSGAFRAEIEVSPGLALDLAGNELHLDTPMCVDIGKWYEDRKAQKELSATDETTEGGRRVATFDAHVIARFRTCLLRPVPSLMEPCSGTGDDTSYSRAFETIELLLRPGLPPAPVTPPYHRLRLLFRLDEPVLDNGQPVDADAEVIKARDDIEAAAEADRPGMLLAAFRWCAALDVIDFAPGYSLDDLQSKRFQLDDRPPVLLASVIGLRLERSSDSAVWTLVQGKVDNTVRPSHVATSTIQELLCGALLGLGGAGSTPAAPKTRGRTAAPTPAPADAGGPRIDPATVKLKGNKIEFATTAPLASASVGKGSVEVQSFDAKNGWQRRDIESIKYDSRSRKVVVELAAETEGQVLRVLARGTGESPLLGTDLTPLAGALDGPAGSQHQGNDFTFMLPIRS